MDCTATVVEIGKNLWEPMCKRKLLINYELKTLFSIASNDLGLENLIFFDTKDQNMFYNRIPPVVVVNELVYSLVAVVQRIKYRISSHYVAFIWRSNGKWHRFDNKLKTTTEVKNKRDEIMVHMLCYKRMESNKRFQMNPSTDSKDFEIIQNSHTVDFNGTNVLVNNCCGPDSILHCLGNIYANKKPAFEEVDSSYILDALEAYVNRNEHDFYVARLKLLLQSGYKMTTGRLNEAVLNARSNIESSLRMICSNDLPSGKVIKKCKCGVKSNTVQLVDIDMAKLVEVGIKELDSCFIFNNQRTRSTCEKCSYKIKTTTQFSSIVFVSIEPMQTVSTNYKLPNQLLNDFPKTIVINSKQYSLEAAIEFQADDNPAMNHYSVHCLQGSMFMEYNDLFNQARPSTVEEIEIQILVYSL